MNRSHKYLVTRNDVTLVRKVRRCEGKDEKAWKNIFEKYQIKNKLRELKLAA